MRRQKDDTWETEVLEKAERLRQALGRLAEQETALGTGLAVGDEILEELDAVDLSREAVDQWWRDWGVRTAELRTSRGVALSVVRDCVPVLLAAVELYGQSLAILVLSPDLEAGDGELARQGVGVAKQVAIEALQFLDETPNLRPVDRAAVDATLLGLVTQSSSMVALLELVGSRARMLQMERGPSF